MSSTMRQCCSWLPAPIALVAVVALVAPFLGCESKKAKPAEPAQAAAAPQPVAQPTVPIDAAPAKPLTEGEVSALVTQWVEVQNKGDFTAYQALYGEAFGGVRRSGEKTVPLDRKAWLAERKRMFKRPVKVEIAELDIKLVGPRATATMVQTWESGTYKDRGEKRLILARAGAGVVITGEEMVSSTIVLTEALALRALFPKMDKKTRQPRPDDVRRVTTVEIRELDGPGSYVCLALLEHPDPYPDSYDRETDDRDISLIWELAVLRLRGGKARVLARTSGTLDRPEADNNVEDEDQKATVAIASIEPISETDDAIVLQTLYRQVNGEMIDGPSGAEEMTIQEDETAKYLFYHVSRRKLMKVLELTAASKRTDYPDQLSVERDLEYELLDETSKGFYHLGVTESYQQWIERSTSEDEEDGNDEGESADEYVYVWDGAEYVKR